MNSGEEKADFTLPGSPLDEYLRTLELGEDNLFDQINSDACEGTPDGDVSSPVANISLKDCLNSRLSELIVTFRQFHSAQENGLPYLQSKIKWGVSSRWYSSLYCPMLNSDQMTIGKTHSALK